MWKLKRLTVCCVSGEYETDDEYLSKDFLVRIKTGDLLGSGTDSNVFVQLSDDVGRVSLPVKITRRLRNVNERGTSCTVRVRDPFLGRVTRVNVWRDAAGLASAWLVDCIEVVSQGHAISVFPVHRWLRAERMYSFQEFDSCLPQEDVHTGVRRRELEEKRHRYAYCLRFLEGPAQVRGRQGPRTLVFFPIVIAERFR